MNLHDLIRELREPNESKIVLLVADGLGGLPMEPGGKTELERYLQEAPTSHGKRQDAENKCKEVKCR